MKTNDELKDSAKINLEEKWVLAIAVSVIAWLLTDAFTGNNGKETIKYIWQSGEFIRTGVRDNGSSSLFTFIAFIIGGPVNFGLAAFFLNLSRNKDAELDQMFSGFNYFGKTFVMNFLITLYTFLWFLLLIVPGIIAAISYSMSYYIMNDNPELTATEAILLSKEMMDGNKARLFVLSLSFFGWFLLAIVTFGLGFLYLMPYYNATKANFYEDIKNGVTL